MRRVLVVTSGRWDAAPLEPVVRACRDKGIWTDQVDFHSKSSLDQPWECYDLFLLLGDRWEALSTAMDATIVGMPIAHIHGGEASFGSMDNQFRDAITKLAHIHFVANETYKKRVVEKLGEDEWRVYVTGAPGLDNLRDMPPRQPRKQFVCTYHPPTLEKGSFIRNLLKALDEFPDFEQIWTTPNTDPGYEDIQDALEGRNVVSVDFAGYRDLCRHAAAVVGNSSSGIIEAPTLQVPSVNVGHRQDGRMTGPSVFNCTNESEGIIRAIRNALDYRGSFENPYGAPGASDKIARILASIDLRNIMVKKWPT